MTMQDNKTTTTAISRRRFLKSAAGMSFGLALTQVSGCDKHQNGVVGKAVEAADCDGSSAYAWVTISPTGSITIQTPADELGQGSMTSLPLILAEELDANWDDVSIKFCEPNDATYGNPKLAGLVLTVASLAVSSYYDRLRLYGAQIRHILLDNVAQHWQVPIKELSTEPSQVVHWASGRRISYGDIVAFAEFPQCPPDITPEQLKSQDQFRLIGADIPRRDIEAKSTGTAQYSIDIQLPDMLYAAVSLPSIAGAKIKTLNADNAKAVRGVKEIVNLNHAVAVVASSFTAASKAQEKLGIEWNKISDFDSDLALQERSEQVRNLAMSGFVWEKEGDIDESFAQADKILEEEYRSDYVYHAQLEPLNSVVWYKTDGKVEVWAGTQAPSHCVRSVAEAVAADVKDVKLHRMYSGGAFGRRGAYDHDYVIDAAILSKRFGQPVKVIWSREDDVRLGRLKPMSAQYLRAGLNDTGDLVAWHHRVASEETLIQGDPFRYEKWGKIPLTGIFGTEQPLYAFPNRKAEHILQQTNIRVSPLRGVGVTPNKFASESFLDEIALAQGIDPLAFRLQLVAHAPRARNVLTQVAEMADWHRPREQTALGLAFTAYDKTLLACICEISLDAEEGLIKTHNIWSVVDPGLVIQPVNAESQIRGGLLFGLSNALKERIVIKNGEIQQSNFHDYPILSAAEMPDIQVNLIQGVDHPSAVGEVGVLLPAAATGNAFARLTGKRLRHMPFTAERVKKALAG